MRIPSRFNGPPASANGGYTCGLVAERLGGPATVRLHAPPPLDTPLDVVEVDGEVRVLHDAAVIATGRPGGPRLEAPAPPSWEAATWATGRYVGLHHHAFPTCFVCGPARAPGDGLRLFTGRVDGTVACPWAPDPSVCEAGVATLPVAWAALDCPSYWGATLDGEHARALLGELSATVAALPREGERCVVLGWPLGVDGRKLRGGSAIWSEDRGLLAVGSALWIVPRAP